MTPIKFEDISSAVSAEFGVTSEELKSPARHQTLMRARHAVTILCRDILHESYPRIGRFVERDHATVMSGYRRGLALYTRDAAYRAKIDAARDRLFDSSASV